MLYILITASVLCNAAPVKTQFIHSSQASFEHDVQLIRRGWYNPNTNGRCKAIKVKYVFSRN